MGLASLFRAYHNYPVSGLYVDSMVMWKSWVNVRLKPALGTLTE